MCWGYFEIALQAAARPIIPPGADMTGRDQVVTFRWRLQGLLGVYGMPV